MKITHQQAPPSRALTQDQRLAWLRELLDGDSESLAYRVAGILLLLFAQPLTKIAALQTSAITFAENDGRISLGKEPIPLPAPFADMLAGYLDSRPNLRAQADSQPARGCSRVCVPAGIFTRRRSWKGLDDWASICLAHEIPRLQSLVVAAPPPLVAELLGYSYNTAQRHAEIAAQPWARYATKTAAEH